MDINIKDWLLIRESYIDDEFQGFDSDMVFVLSDGSYWYQNIYKYRYHYAYRPLVKIYERFGRRIMIVQGLDDYVDVQQTTGFSSIIVNEFKGWSGDSVFELQNGQIWRQDKYQYKYFYAYRPRAYFVKIGIRFIMKVKGRSIRVRRVR